MLQSILVPKSFSLAATFGLDPNEVDPSLTVEGFEIPDPATLADPLAAAHAEFLRKAIPAVDPLYEFRKELIREIRFWWLTGEGDVLYLWGPTGCGKTSVFEQWCARLGIPMFAAKGHRRFEPHEAFGQFVGGENGTTPWMNGPVTLAAMYGLPCIINEYDRIASDRTIVFNDVFEGRPFPVPGKAGEVVVQQPGARYVLTGNTNMVEDLSGNYGTANCHDISILERLYPVQVGYPTDDTEANVLTSVLEEFSDELLSYWFDQEGMKLTTSPGTTKEGAAISRSEFIGGLLEVTRRIRAQSKDGGNASDSALERTMSTRMLRKWARNAVLQAGAPEKLGLSALHLSLRKLSSLATESTRIALHKAVESVFGIDEKVSP